MGVVTNKSPPPVRSGPSHLDYLARLLYSNRSLLSLPRSYALPPQARYYLQEDRRVESGTRPPLMLVTPTRLEVKVYDGRFDLVEISQGGHTLSNNSTCLYREGGRGREED